MRLSKRILGVAAAAMLLASSAVSHAGPVTNDERITAMLSIHAHANWPERNFPKDVKLINLNDAVGILRRDEGKLALSRRRRAVGKLAAYGLGRPDFRDAIRALGADPDRIVHGLAQEARVRGTAFSENAGARETFVNDMNAKLFDPPCTWTALNYAVGGTETAVVVSTTLAVDWDAKRVARAIDPQAWDQCSKFWQPAPDGAYLAKDDLSHDTDVPFGEAYGGSLGLKLLFERFQCVVSGCDATFKNLLYVSTRWDTPTPGMNRYNVSYSLDRCVEGTVLKQPEKIAVDQGDLTVEQGKAGGTTVTVYKKLTYENPALTGMAQAILAQTEAAAEFAEVVCCPVGETTDQPQ